MADDGMKVVEARAVEVVERAQKAGASVAEAVARDGRHLSAKVRMGTPELLEEAGSRSLGLRVMLGQRVAVAFTNDLSDDGCARLVDDAVELAKLSEEDPFAGPPDPSLLADRAALPDLDLHDPSLDAIDGAEAIRRATEAEAAALAFDPRVSNSEGATFTRASGGSVLVTSGGFVGSTAGTFGSLVVHPVAREGDGDRQSGYYYSARRFDAAIEDPEAVGREAARRTVAKLGASKMESAELPVVFDPDAGRSILSLLAGCISGSAIWRKSSYLAGRVGTKVAAEGVTLIDDPLRPRGPGSRAFDGEGLAARKNVVVQGGNLETYLLDTYSAKKLDLASTGSASRGGSGGVGISTSNLILEPGSLSPEEVMAPVARGLYVTDMMGYGFNAVTGDFSRGASGFLIEDGKLGRPVSEITISLNLDQLLQRIDALGDDLDVRSGIACPTFRVSAMTIAGA